MGSGLSPEEVRIELLELARLSGVPMKEQVFDTLLELLRHDCTPASVCSVLKNLAIKPQGRPTFAGATNALLAAQALGVTPKR